MDSLGLVGAWKPFNTKVAVAIVVTQGVCEPDGGVKQGSSSRYWVDTYLLDAIHGVVGDGNWELS